jgi:hypothetical protein
LIPKAKVVEAIGGKRRIKYGAEWFEIRTKWGCAHGAKGTALPYPREGVERIALCFSP